MTPVFEAPVALSGEFTVKDAEGANPAKKVRFSPGNLRCNPVGMPGNYTSGVWGFFDNQYECGPSSYSDGHDKEISLFTWGYDAEKSIVPNGNASDNVSRTSGNLEQTEDWGSQIGDGNTWRTLTNEEWEYLFNIRTMTNEANRYEDLMSGLTVGSVVFKGVVLFPDNFTEKDTWKTNYTTWEALNSAGLVFLPAAGARDSSDVIYVGDAGGYWSSAANGEDCAYDVNLGGSETFPDDGDDRNYGLSVRLITECQ